MLVTEGRVGCAKAPVPYKGHGRRGALGPAPLGLHPTRLTAARPGVCGAAELEHASSGALWGRVKGSLLWEVHLVAHAGLTFVGGAPGGPCRAARDS